MAASSLATTISDLSVAVDGPSTSEGLLVDLFLLLLYEILQWCVPASLRHRIGLFFL